MGFQHDGVVSQTDTKFGNTLEQFLNYFQGYAKTLLQKPEALNDFQANICRRIRGISAAFSEKCIESCV